MPAALWQLERVTLAGTLRPRLEDVTVEIPQGRTAVLGYSGAGKTSLLNLLVRFERPDAGSIRDCSLPREVEAVGGLPVYWAPQNDGLWPHLTAADHITAVRPRIGGASTPAAAEFLAAFDLGDKCDERPARLSRGERSRLSLARALATGAQVLVLDEPLAHVDPARVEKYWGVVRRAIKQSAASLVFATHSPETALTEAEFVICLDAGRVAYAGGVRELYVAPPTPELAAFLGPANWFSPEEARVWLAQQLDRDTCYRPERLHLEMSADGPCVIQTTRFAGSYAEVELLHESSQRRRTVYHRPRSDDLRPGQRVSLCIHAD